VLPSTSTDCERSLRTFQEGYLAKRRLIFTDSQVLYVCSKDIHAESFNSAIPMLNSNYEMNVLEFFSSAAQKSRDISLETLIMAYTERNLYYDADALNAFLGVLKSWSNSSSINPYPVRVHLWGLPMEDDTLCLHWFQTRPGKRRPEFPTWSWVGSKGGVQFHYRSKNTSNTGTIHVGYSADLIREYPPMERQTQYPTPWTDAYQYFSDPDASPTDTRDAPRYLLITSLCAHFGLSYDSRYQIWRGSLIAANHRPDHECMVFMDYVIPPEIDHSDWLAIQIRGCHRPSAHLRLKSPFVKPYIHGGVFLLLRPIGTLDVYERVGLMDSTYESFSFDDWQQSLFFERTVVVK
jgi:hypothetical protein